MSKLILILLTKIYLVASLNIFDYDSNEVPGDYDYHEVHNGLERAKSFLDEWTVKVEGGEEIAQLVALELGYIYGGPVLGFEDTYTFINYAHSKDRRTPSAHTSKLISDRRIKWADQLFYKMRVKREFHSDEELFRVKRIEDNSTKGVKRTKRHAIDLMFNDELWEFEWYLRDTRTKADLPRLDLNVLPVYEMGYNGMGIRLTVLDDGIEHNHTDLKGNYDPEISWDCNDHDSDPSPRYDIDNRNSHGTRCAGEIAMTANNKKCGVGVAWGASIGGIRMLDGRITDRIEGEAIGFAWDKVDIYSASWGPNDDGATVEGPGRLAAEALERGIKKGRNGKGTIFVWANGNGGRNYDNCNCDGYSSSIYTVSIGSASQHGMFPWYGETCSSTLAVAYSSGAYKDQKITTTDIRDTCTKGHTGTSAAAPLAAGIIALALQANRDLTWRDIQHLLAWTSEYAPLSANPGWQANAIGLRFDVRFGFGLINAASLVKSAMNWTTVPKKFIDRFEWNESCDILSGKQQSIYLKVNGSEINYSEHIELVVNIEYSRRGALEIFLISPQGTRVQILSTRPKDSSSAGFINWPLVSIATWGENPIGIWKVIIQDMTNENNKGVVTALALVIHGTHEMPAYMKHGPRKYEAETYQEVFDYFDNVADKDDITAVDAELPGEHIVQEDVDPTLLAEMEKELLRVHHRQNLYRFGDYS